MTESPGEPVGNPLRAFDPTRDYEALAGLVHAANLFDHVDDLPTVETLRAEQEHLGGFDPARDVVLAESGGTLNGAARLTARIRDGRGSYHFEIWVAPAWRGQALESTLFGWIEARAAAMAGEDNRPGPPTLETWIDHAQLELAAILVAGGLRVVRHGLRMRRDLDVPLPAAELPAGVEIRPVAEADLRRIWDADAEAFQDHWNSAQRTEADFEGWLAEPELDTGLWRVAWAGPDVAGSVQCSIWATENEMLGFRRGWLDHVSVRRPWRRRGLAAALIVDALSGLQAAGMAEAALGVDAENPTGAVALYERLGFRATRTTLNYARQF